MDNGDVDTNSYLVWRVLHKTCTCLLRDILRHLIPEQKLPLFINEEAMKEKLMKILNKSQKHILYPQRGYFNGNYKELDISILYILIRNVSKIPEHRNGWGNAPDVTDDSVAANVERLREIRNKHLHASEHSMSKDDFETQWNKIINCIKELEATLSDVATNYTYEANELKTKKFDLTQYEEFIYQVKKNADENRDSICGMEKRQAEFEEKLNKMDTKISSQENEFQNIQAQTDSILNVHRDSKTYLRTGAVDVVISKLSDYKIAIITGKQGDGKTKLAYQVMCELYHSVNDCASYTVKRPVIISEPDHWFKYIDPKREFIVYIDDFVGATNFTKDRAARWKVAIESLYASTKNGNLFLLVGMQKQILDEAREQFFHHKLFSEEYVVDTSSLTIDEKRMIYDKYEDQYVQTKLAPESSAVIAQKEAQKFKSLNDKEKEKAIVNNESAYGFPLTCYLFFNEQRFHDMGSAFFKLPDKNLSEEVEQMRKKNDFSYIILVYILIREKIAVHKPDEKLLIDLCTMLNYPESHTTRCISDLGIMDAVENLQKSFIEKIGHSEEYQFSHKTVSDNVLLSFGKVAPTFVLENCSRRHLFELIRTRKTSENSTELVILPKHFEALAERLLRVDDNNDIKGRMTFMNTAINIVWHPASADEYFVDQLLHLDKFSENENLLSKIWYVIPGSTSSAMLDKMMEQWDFSTNKDKNVSINKDGEVNEKQSRNERLLKQKSKFDILKSCIVQCIDNYAGDRHILCCLKHIEKDTNLYKLLDFPFKYSPNEMTLLHCSILHRWEDVVDKILNVHKPTMTKNGWTCLHFAAYIGSSTLFEKFLEYGQNIESVTEEGYTVLQSAFLGMRYGPTETNWPLYSVSEKNRFQMTFSFPSQNEYKKTLGDIFQRSPTVLLDENTMKVDDYDNTIFHYLVLQDYSDILNLLSQQFEDSVLERNTSGLPTLLHLAVYLGRPLITRILWMDAVRPLKNDPTLEDTLNQGQRFKGMSIAFSYLNNTTPGKICWNDGQNEVEGIKIKCIASLDVIFGKKEDFEDVQSFLQSQGEL